MTPDHGGMEVLEPHECHTLLSRTSFGRVAVCIGALPAVFPIHYSLLDGDPVFRTAGGTKLRAASHRNVLCLEIDEVDGISHHGWSVMVTGPASVIDDPAEIGRAEALPLRPWTGTGDEFIRIRATIVTGRRIGSDHLWSR